MNSPKLRFKNFNDEWISKKLGDICNIVMGQSPNSENYNNGHNGIPLIQGNADILDRKTNPQNFTIQITKTCNIGDILMSVRAPVGNVAISYHYACIGRGICSISTKLSQKYVYQFLISYEKNWRKISQGSTFQSINSKDICNIIINLPSIEEQTKIANFLSLIDRKIELQEKLVENLKLYKKGLLQKVFSNNQEWNHVELYTVCDVRDGTHNSPKYTENGYPLVTSKNLSKNGQLDFSNISYISQKDFDEINKRSKVNVGDILFGMIGTIGNPVLLTKDEFAIKNVALIKEKTKLKNKFLIQFLNSSAIENQFNFNKTGGTQKFIALNSIRKLLVPIPSIEEQNQIANLFTNLDKKIELETKKLQDLKTYKKGLLQKMFI